MYPTSRGQYTETIALCSTARVRAAHMASTSHLMARQQCRCAASAEWCTAANGRQGIVHLAHSRHRRGLFPGAGRLSGSCNGSQTVIDRTGGEICCATCKLSSLMRTRVALQLTMLLLRVESVAT